ncbi:MAG TPA: M67 family metallopeptidase [Blastocatellia bacterium]|nr:M67 family metallopeptidase [Blastocatellia bacterium]
MAIKVKKEHLEQIRSHGEQTYPRECCGFLLGSREAGAREDGINILQEVYPADNEWNDSINGGDTLEEATPAGLQSEEVKRRESQKNRYWITPEQYRRADRYARERKLGIIGYYHSHPDHPAAPSGYDLDHSCWPTESYIIVAVDKGKAAALNSFTKPDYAKFEQEEIFVEES